MVSKLIKIINLKYLSSFYAYIQGIFWELWSIDFMNDSWQLKIFDNHDDIIKAIKIEKPKYILEVGCGFGRNIKYLIEKGVDPEIITATDISRGMIFKAKSFVDNNKVTYKVANIIDLPFKNNSFDFVIVYTVFMHISPNQIKNAIKEVKRVSSKTIVVVEQNYEPSGDTISAKRYTFIHDYKKLFTEQGIEIKKYSSRKRKGNDFIILKV